MDRHSASPARTGSPGHNGRGHASAGTTPAGRSAYLVTVLARALAAQADELGRTAEPVPDGWWFAESAAPGAASGVDGPYGYDGAAEPAGYRATDGYDGPDGYDGSAGYDGPAGYDGTGASR